MPPKRIALLIFRDLKGELSAYEASELLAWRQLSADNQRFYAEAVNEETLAQMIQQHHPANKESIRQRILSRVEGQLSAPIVQMPRTRFRRAALAACIIVLAGFGAYFLFRNDEAPLNPPMFQTADIKAPASNHAEIRLADGRTIYLDSANNGQLAVEENVRVIKLANGQIVYQTSGVTPATMQYNTLTNPRGSKVIDIKLADGTKVWLNAGSSMTYPVAFAGNDRSVTVSGEAYFEVTHDPAKPFKVSKRDITVSVLGTHFNVNAYDDDDDMKITLLEGSVRVSDTRVSLVIKPHQQAVVKAGKLAVNSPVDTDQVMAWKNGKFDFGEGTSVKEIMKQVARWYDVDIVYNTSSSQQFWGSVSRESNLTKLLEKLSLTGRIKFKIENRKIIVNP